MFSDWRYREQWEFRSLLPITQNLEPKIYIVHCELRLVFLFNVMYCLVCHPGPIKFNKVVQPPLHIWIVTFMKELRAFTLKKILSMFQFYQPELERIKGFSLYKEKILFGRTIHLQVSCISSVVLKSKLTSSKSKFTYLIITLILQLYFD